MRLFTPPKILTAFSFYFYRTILDVKARAEQWFVSVLENIKDPLEAMINSGQSINERFHPNLKVRG